MSRRKPAKRVVEIVALEGTPGDEVCEAIGLLTTLCNYRLETTWEMIDSRAALARCEIEWEGQDHIHLQIRILPEKEFRELLEIKKSLRSDSPTLFLDVKPHGDIHSDCEAVVVLAEQFTSAENSTDRYGEVRERAENILRDHVLLA